MASRRAFTFGSMVLALTGARAAQAGIPELDVPVEPNSRRKSRSPEPQPSLDIAFATSRARGLLEVVVTVTNRSADPVEFVAARGSRPGPWLTAVVTVDEARFELPVVFEADRRQFFSRVGPAPRWEMLAAGSSATLDPYRFEWPKGLAEGSVALTVEVEVMGQSVPVRHTATVGGAAKAV